VQITPDTLLLAIRNLNDFPLEPLALVSSARDLLGTSALTRPSRRSSITR